MLFFNKFKNFSQTNLAEVFDQAWQLKQAGYSLDEILACFPQAQRAALKSLLIKADQLAKDKNLIQPAPQLLHNILANLESKQTSVTNQTAERFTYQEAATSSVKGRNLNFRQISLTNLFNYMSQNKYLYATLAVLVIAVVAGVWYWAAPNKSSNNQDQLTYVMDNLDQDINDLKDVADDSALNTLDDDLAALAGNENQAATTENNSSNQPSGQAGQPVINTQDLEQIETELGSDVDDFSNDLNDLGSFESDSSLDNLDDSLGNLSS